VSRRDLGGLAGAAFLAVVVVYRFFPNHGGPLAR
jgi:hypothetical protein